MSAKKDGKGLQLLVRAIESAIAAGSANINIEMSKRFPDKVTGKPREHDVVLIMTHGHHQTVIALECRDRSRPVGVEAVEAFHSKCQHTGIHSGIIVSGKGFYKTAIEKATHYNIGCLTLDEAKSFGWCLAGGVDTCRREVRHTHLHLIFAADHHIKANTIQMEDGTLVNEDTIRSWAKNALDHYHPIPMEGAGEHHVVLKEPDPKVYGIRGDGNRVQAIEAQFSVQYTALVGYAPFSFRTYMDVGRSKQVRQVAICPVSVSDSEVADLVLSPNDEGLITIALVKSPPALTAGEQ